MTYNLYHTEQQVDCIKFKKNMLKAKRLRLGENTFCCKCSYRKPCYLLFCSIGNAFRFCWLLRKTKLPMTRLFPQKNKRQSNWELIIQKNIDTHFRLSLYKRVVYTQCVAGTLNQRHQKDGDLNSRKEACLIISDNCDWEYFVMIG